jgi:hypothetical protein
MRVIESLAGPIALRYLFSRGREPVNDGNAPENCVRSGLVRKIVVTRSVGKIQHSQDCQEIVQLTIQIAKDCACPACLMSLHDCKHRHIRHGGGHDQEGAPECLSQNFA